jgi:hypothetical protein
MTSTGGLRVGILIIGSLLWDLMKYDRGRWQHERLDMAAKQRVKAPIRYGRSSSGGERQGQYTMTLSRSAGLGIAYAVPCKKVMSNIADLEAEVRALAVAEGLVDYYGASRWKTFGAIGVGLREATGERVAPLAEQWGQSFGFRCNLQTTLWETFNQLDEAPPLSHAGLLTIEWPADADSGEPLTFDLLLAVATEPTPVGRRYAKATEIAESLVNVAGGAEYFRQNVLNGIRTQDDQEIWGALEASGAAWVRSDRYARLDACLRPAVAIERG